MLCAFSLVHCLQSSCFFLYMPIMYFSTNTFSVLFIYIYKYICAEHDYFLMRKKLTLRIMTATTVESCHIYRGLRKRLNHAIYAIHTVCKGNGWIMLYMPYILCAKEMVESCYICHIYCVQRKRLNHAICPIYHRNLNTFVAVITPPPPPFLLCRYFWYQLVAYCVCFKMICEMSL